MNKVAWKASTLSAPLPPVMVSCGDMEKSNILTIAWTGIVNTIPPMTYISVRPERFSYDIIKKSGEFVINLTTSDLVKSADWCGVKSGAQFDKFAEMKLTKEQCLNVSCPAISESPLNLECKVKEIIHLGSHDMFLAEIVGLNVEANLIDENGRLMLEKAHLAAFAHGEYFELGKKLGSFGFSVKKKTVPKKNKPNKPNQSRKAYNKK